MAQEGILVRSTSTRPFEDADFERVRDLRNEAFRRGSEIEGWRSGGWVLEGERGNIVAALRMHDVGQFFGGRSVRTAVLSSVMTAPESRGRGYGGQLLEDVLREMRGLGIAQCTAFPSTPVVYRRVGFEFAGCYTRYVADLRDVDSKARGSLEPRETNDGDLRELYRNFARANDGLIDRSEAWWREQIEEYAPSDPRFTFVTREEERLTGYVSYVQHPTGELRGYGVEIVIKDLVWTNTDALGALLSMMTGQRGHATRLLWPGSGADPVALAMGNSLPMVDHAERWISRILDPTLALESRGYAPSVTARLAFELVDPVFGPSPPVQISVDQGVGAVTPVDTGDLRIDVRALSGIFTGWLDPRAARSLGLIDGADAATMGILCDIFRVGSPWRMELF